MGNPGSLIRGIGFVSSEAPFCFLCAGNQRLSLRGLFWRLKIVCRKGKSTILCPLHSFWSYTLYTLYTLTSYWRLKKLCLCRFYQSIFTTLITKIYFSIKILIKIFIALGNKPTTHFKNMFKKINFTNHVFMKKAVFQNKKKPRRVTLFPIFANLFNIWHLLICPHSDCCGITLTPHVASRKLFRTIMKEREWKMQITS